MTKFHGKLWKTSLTVDVRATVKVASRHLMSTWTHQKITTHSGIRNKQFTHDWGGWGGNGGSSNPTGAQFDGSSPLIPSRWRLNLLRAMRCLLLSINAACMVTVGSQWFVDWRNFRQKLHFYHKFTFLLDSISTTPLTFLCLFLCFYCSWILLTSKHHWNLNATKSTKQFRVIIFLSFHIYSILYVRISFNCMQHNRFCCDKLLPFVIIVDFQNVISCSHWYRVKSNHVFQLFLFHKEKLFYTHNYHE